MSPSMEYAHGLMMFLGALTDGLERNAGRGAIAVSYDSGLQLGMKATVSRQCATLKESLQVLPEALRAMGIIWEFDLRNISEDEFNHAAEIRIPFYNCQARCTLHRYGYPQGRPLCQTKHGLFAGLLKKIWGHNVKLDIFRPGENACLLILRIPERKAD